MKIPSPKDLARRAADMTPSPRNVAERVIPRSPADVARRLLLLAALLLAVYWTLVMFQSPVPFRLVSGGSYEVTAIFEEVSGLPKDADVLAGGGVVGKVQDIELKGPRLLPHVTLVMDGSFRLRQGSIVDLRQASNSGQLNRYIDVAQGKGPELSDGATVGLAMTDQPVEIDKILRVLDPAGQKNVQGIFDSLEKGVRGHQEDIYTSVPLGKGGFKQTAALVAEINADGEALRTLVDEGNRVVSAVSQDPESLGEMVDQTSGLLETTASREEELALTAQAAGPALREPRRALARLNTAIPTLRALVRDGRPAVRELVPTARELRPTLRAARPTLREANLLTRRSPADLEALTPTLVTANRVVPELKKIVCRANPILDTLRASFPDAIGGLIGFSSINRNYDINGHGARVFTHARKDPGAREVEPDEDTTGFQAKPLVRVPGVHAQQPWRAFEDSYVGGNGDCR